MFFFFSFFLSFFYFFFFQAEDGIRDTSVTGVQTCALPILQYLRSLVARAMALQSWVEKVERNSLLNEPLLLNELFHPDTFLNALRQQTARLVQVPPDRKSVV